MTRSSVPFPSRGVIGRPLEMLRVASRPRSKRAFIEVYDAARKLQSCGKSSAAPIPSSSFEQQKREKKISKQERRAIVEAFVDKYRASNQGRFPTASHATQHIGGSFYIVKQIIQELEYNLRMSAPSENKGPQIGKTEKVKDPACSAKLDELSRSSEMVSCITRMHPLDPEIGLNSEVVNNINIDQIPLVKHEEGIGLLEAKQPLLSANSEDASVNEPLNPLMAVPNARIKENVENVGIPSISSSMMIEIKIVIENQDKLLPGRSNERTKDDQGSVRFSLSVSSAPTDSSVVDKEPSKHCDHSEEFSADPLMSVKLEGEVSCSPPQEIKDSAKGKIYAESFLGAHGHKEFKQVSSHELPKSDEHTSAHLRISERGESSPKGSNLWDNLKSLADGIFKFWKKM